MIFFGVFLGLCIMAAMVYMALDKKSNLRIRLASLAALALMIITVIVCVFIVFTDKTVPVDESVLIVGAPAPVQEEQVGSSVSLVVIVFFLLAFFALIVFLALREHRKQLPT